MRAQPVRQGWPQVTALITAMCIGLFLLEILVTRQMGGEEGFTPSGLALAKLGAAYAPFFNDGQYWRALTAVFLHGGALHILMNSLGLWTVGGLAEQRFGSAQTLVVFIVTGAIGEAATCLVHANVLSVGASGGIFGLIGLCAVNALKRKDSELKARLIPWIGYGLIMSFAVPGIDYVAHIGGLASGALLGVVVGDVGTRRTLPDAAWTALAVVCAAAVAGSFFLASQAPVQ